jgi:hypothetical protein
MDDVYYTEVVGYLYVCYRVWWCCGQSNDKAGAQRMNLTRGRLARH